MNDVSVKNCPSCGGRLVFHPESNQMKCDSCGSFRPVEYAGKEAQAKQGVFTKALAECSCQTCGAQVCAQDEVISLGCPYCGNPLVISSRVSDRFRPDGIIPFAFYADEAMRIFQKYTSKLWFVPKQLKQHVKPSDFRAMYAPFYLYDFDVKSQIGRKGKTGRMEVHKLPIDASTNFPDDLMDNISPYDYQKMTAFSSDYLRGFLGEVYNENSAEFIPRAGQMVQKTLESYAALALDKMPGHITDDMTLETKRVYYVLLPVYLFSLTYHGKRYFFAVNGQTGKVAGNLPYETELKSMSKIMALVLWFIFGFPALAFAILVLISALFGAHNLDQISDMLSNMSAS